MLLFSRSWALTLKLNKVMLVDTHAHLNFNAYKDDVNEVIKRALDNNIWMFNVGSQYSTSKRAIEIAEKYPEGVYAAVGLHPIHLETGLVKIKIDPEEIEFKTIEEDFNVSKYRSLAQSSKKVIAIGEIGLDYYWKPKTKIRIQQFKEKQKNVLCQQIELAQELNLPIIFHCRMAHQDLIDVLKSEIPILDSPSLDSPSRRGGPSKRGGRNPTTAHLQWAGSPSSYSRAVAKSETNPKSQIPNSKLRGIIHCFTGNWEEAKQYLELGLYLGFNGIIFKFNVDEIIRKMPLARILLETDCPYLTPSQVEGRNEPIFVKYIAEKIAKIKNISYEKVSEITTENAKNLFKISKRSLTPLLVKKI